MPFELSRRQVLTGAAAAAGVALVGAGTSSAAASPVAETAEPFLLGVASGDPLPDGVVLWTRLVRNTFNASSMSARRVPVGWQIAEDERFRRVARAGIALARPELAHSVHVDVRGLRPGREYSTGSGPGATSARSAAPAPRRHTTPTRTRCAWAW